MSTSPPLVVADRYRLVAPLGQGGMGRVWRATDVVLHRDVAIKELVPPPGLTFDERRELRERSLREARAIARLNNINVVRVFDVLRTDADPWIVMEYVPSRSLQDMLATDGPFPPVRAVEIGLGMLNALRAAHRNGVVHRDVKPGNVLIGEDGRVVLTDFGLATVPGDPNVTRTGLVLGSPAYIAPERARDGTAGPAADLWSLGATLYAAVEGASPFARPSAMATLAALATENVPPARNAGPLKPVLNGLLRKDPTHRISAEEAERLLLRANGRRSKLGFPMSPTMRRPGVGRERSAFSPTPPPAAPAASGSAPVVPGPRPPATPGRPPVSPAAAGPPGEGRRPIYAPGKASVGPPGRPADTPARVDGPRLDATRVDTPPVRSTPDQDLSRTGSNAPNSTTDQINEAAPSRAPAQGARAEGAPARGALAKGTRGAYGTITPGEGTRRGGVTDQSAREAAGGTAAKTAGASSAAEREAAERAAAEREAGERAEAERQAAATAAAEREAAEKAAAEREAVEKATAEREAAGRAEAERQAAGRQAAARAAAEREAAGRAEAERQAAERQAAARAAAEREAADKAAERQAADKGAAERQAAERVDREREAAAKTAAKREAVERARAERGEADSAAEKAATEEAPAGSAATDKATAETAAAEVGAAPGAAASPAAGGPLADGGPADGESVNAEVAMSPSASATDSAEAVRGGADTDGAGGANGEAGSAAVSVSEAKSPTSGADDAGPAATRPKAATKPPVGARAGAHSTSKASRKKSRSRRTGGAVAGTNASAAQAGATPVERPGAPAPSEAPTPQSAAVAKPIVSSDDAEAARATAESVAIEAGAASQEAEANAKADGLEAAGIEQVGAAAHDDSAAGTDKVGAAAQDMAATAAGTEAGGGAADGDLAAGGVEIDEARTSPEEVAASGPDLSVVPGLAAEEDSTEHSAPAQPGAEGGAGKSRSPKVAAARSGERKVTTAALPAATIAGGRTVTAAGSEGATAAGAAVIGVPLARGGGSQTTVTEGTQSRSAGATGTKRRSHPTSPSGASPGGTDYSGTSDGGTRDSGTSGVGTSRGGASGVGKQGGVSGFDGSSRPAWRPMPVKPRSGGDGVTVLGVTLTRRQTVIAGAILLALVLALIFILPRTFGGDDKAADNDRRTGAGPAASGPAGPTTTAPTAVQPAPSTPAASTRPSPAPATANGGGGVKLPAGWYLYKDKTGFSVPVPQGWAIKRVGTEVYFQERGGQYRLLIVDQTDKPHPDPVKDWETKEADRISGYRDYHRIAIRPVSYWDKAADWEYTRTSDSGNPLHVVKRGFITAKDQAYGITWSTSARDWNANRSNLDLIYKGFIPAKT